LNAILIFKENKKKIKEEKNAGGKRVKEWNFYEARISKLFDSCRTTLYPSYPILLSQWSVASRRFRVCGVSERSKVQSDRVWLLRLLFIIVMEIFSS
jgi:hypothetical protein